LKIPLLDNIPLYHMLKLGDRYQHIWDNWRMMVAELITWQHEDFRLLSYVAVPST
jgi:hypothetical protein